MNMIPSATPALLYERAYPGIPTVPAQGFLGQAPQTIVFTSGHRYTATLTSTGTPLTDPSMAPLIQQALSNFAPLVGHSRLVSDNVTPTSEVTVIDYQGATTQVNFPAMPPGVTLTVQDMGPIPSAPSSSTKTWLIIGAAVAAVAVAGGVAYYVAHRQ